MIQPSTLSRGDASSCGFEFPEEQVNPVRVSIAQLTDLEIDRMEEHDLVDVIEMADIRPVDRRLLRSLEFRKIGDLKRIVHATRTACRDYWLRAKSIAEAKAENHGDQRESAGEATIDLFLGS